MKVISRSKVLGSPDMDSVANRKREYGSKKNMILLERAHQEWENLRPLREQSERSERYCYGDQWEDYIEEEGKKIKERDSLAKQGLSPLTNNLIRRLVTTVVGVYTKAVTEPVCSARDRDEQKVSDMMTIALQCNWQTQKMPVILQQMFEGFLISGTAIAKEEWRRERGKEDTDTRSVSVNSVFFSSQMKDARHKDIDMIGEIHDMTFRELCGQFVHSEEDYVNIKEIYSVGSRNSDKADTRPIDEKNKLRGMSFLEPEDKTKCRVIEVWTKEIKPRYMCWDISSGETYRVELEDKAGIDLENARRIAQAKEYGIADPALIDVRFIMDEYWYYQFLSPYGDILDEGETPYMDGSHPYSIKLYPFIEGKVHSFVGDIIDQQRYINMMITLNYFIIRNSAKGVLFVNEESVPDGMSNEEFAEQWTRCDGVIFYTARPGVEIPQQIAQNSTSVGTDSMIKLQMDLINDISGVSGALQGKTPYSGTSASLYAQQTQNNTATLASVFQAFSSFVTDIAKKKVAFIQQFYTNKRIVNIAGKNYSGIKVYDPEKVRDIEFDLSIQESAATPVARMMQNDLLMQMWQAGAIDPKMMLKVGDFAFADQLIQMMEAKEEQEMQMAQQQMAQQQMAQQQMAQQQQVQ